MSWEEMSKKEVKCPCKKGVVTLTTYGDDWNRFKESASIEADQIDILEIMAKNLIVRLKKNMKLKL